MTVRKMRICMKMTLKVAIVDTVSAGKGFGSKGRQHHKHTASETQSHNK